MEHNGEYWDPTELVPCPDCDRTTRRRCKTCRGRRRLLRGNPPGHPYEITIDLCTGMYPCCTKGTK
jgi:hypothetical protein